MNMIRAALRVAADLVVAKEEEHGACPLCGAIRPECTHVAWARATMDAASPEEILAAVSS